MTNDTTADWRSHSLSVYPASTRRAVGFVVKPGWRTRIVWFSSPATVRTSCEPSSGTLRDLTILAWAVEAVVVQGAVIEDYPEDVRGHSCLMLATPEGRAVHVGCSPKADYLAVITAYQPVAEVARAARAQSMNHRARRPDPAHWSADFRERKP